MRVAGVISDKVNLWHEVADADAGWVTPAEAGPFATAILAALGDVDGARGRALVGGRFQWPQIGRALEDAYASIV